MLASLIPSRPARGLTLALLSFLALPLGAQSEQAAADPTPTAPAPAPASSEAIAALEALTGRIQGKAMAGARTEADFAEELAELDALVERTAADRDEDAGRIAMTRALLRAQLGADLEKVVVLLREVATGYPGTEAAMVASDMITRAEAALAKREAASQLVGQPAPELDFTWSTREGLAKLSDLKGKVVVLDFWATWCGPCIRSFPQVKELTAHYADSPVEVVGVTSLQGKVHGLQPTPINTEGDPAREHALMDDFIAAKDITWTIAFSEQEVFNPDYGVTGIPHMAIIAPDGTVRHSGLHPAMPHAEKTAMIDAILREFELPVPSAE